MTAAALLVAASAFAQQASPTRAALESAAASPVSLDATFDGEAAEPKFTIPEAQWGLGAAVEKPKPPKAADPGPDPKHAEKKFEWWTVPVGLGAMGAGAGLGYLWLGVPGAVGGALLLALVVGLIIAIVETV